MISSPPSLRQLAAEELLARRTARRTLEAFTRYTYPRYVVEPAHALLARALDRVVSGELKRLMVFAPPQHGKSELVSVRLPPYWLGRRPDSPVIMSSYAASLVESKSRLARQIVEGPEYRNLFPGVRTRGDSRAVNHWSLDGSRGSVLAVGVGGPVTGHGGLLGIIDDPIENWEQAQSQTILDKVWEWWRTTFRTRIWEGGSIVLVMTRWSKGDLAGRLLAEQAGEWCVLRLPAVAETRDERDAACKLLGLPQGQSDPLGRAAGEPLCPLRFSADELGRLKRDVGPLAWPGQYQGAPDEPGGNIFRREWWRRYDDIGDAYRLDTGEVIKKEWLSPVTTLDPASSKKKTSKYTAIGTYAQTDRRQLLVLDMVRERLAVEEIVPALYDVCCRFRPAWAGIEDTGFQVALVNEANDLARYPEMPTIYQMSPAGRGKLERARPAVIRASQGMIYLPTSAPWLEAFENELAAFKGDERLDTFTDQVDTLAYAVLGLDQYGAASGEAPSAGGRRHVPVR